MSVALVDVEDPAATAVTVKAATEDVMLATARRVELRLASSLPSSAVGSAEAVALLLLHKGSDCNLGITIERQVKERVIPSLAVALHCLSLDKFNRTQLQTSQRLQLTPPHIPCVCKYGLESVIVL